MTAFSDKILRDEAQRLASHYDSAAAESCEILGGVERNYHVGFFEHPDYSLEQAQRVLTDRIGDCLDIPRNATVLDIGCGVGGPACHLALTRGWRIRGFTISPFQLRRGQETIMARGCGSMVDLAVGDAHRLPIEDDSFDAVYGIESFAHFGDKARVLREVRRILLPGGCMAIWDLVARNEAVWEFLPMLHLYSIDEYRARFTEVGFEVTSAVDHGDSILLRSMEIFIGRLDPNRHRDTISCCEAIRNGYLNNTLGYALIAARTVE